MAHHLKVVTRAPEKAVPGLINGLTDPAQGFDCRVYLDGREIRGVGLDIKLTPGREPVKVTLEFCPSEMDIDLDTALIDLIFRDPLVTTPGRKGHYQDLVYEQRIEIPKIPETFLTPPSSTYEQVVFGGKTEEEKRQIEQSIQITHLQNRLKDALHELEKKDLLLKIRLGEAEREQRRKEFDETVLKDYQELNLNNPVVQQSVSSAVKTPSMKLEVKGGFENINSPTSETREVDNLLDSTKAQIESVKEQCERAKEQFEQLLNVQNLLLQQQQALELQVKNTYEPTMDEWGSY